MLCEATNQVSYNRHNRTIGESMNRDGRFKAIEAICFRRQVRWRTSFPSASILLRPGSRCAYVF